MTDTEKEIRRILDRVNGFPYMLTVTVLAVIIMTFFGLMFKVQFETLEQAKDCTASAEYLIDLH